LLTRSSKMYRLKSLALLSSILLQLSVVRGQSFTTITPPSASSTSSRQPITRTIAVAKVSHRDMPLTSSPMHREDAKQEAQGGHTFIPDVTQAEVGDFVEFQFYPTNHSVVRAAYKFPCIPFEKIETDKVGFFSGFHPVDAILDKPPTWTVRVNDTDPMFFYCSAPGSCINYAMVGVINPNASTSLEVQRDNAEKSQFMLQPGQVWLESLAEVWSQADRKNRSFLMKQLLWAGPALRLRRPHQRQHPRLLQ
jgi:plastocyanin